jgi:hypothetical protein
MAAETSAQAAEKPRCAGVLKGQGLSRLEVASARLEAAPFQNQNADLLRFLIALFAVAQSQANPDGHESNWREQQHHNPARDRVLTFFVEGAGSAIAHGAALS